MGNHILLGLQHSDRYNHRLIRQTLALFPFVPFQRLCRRGIRPCHSTPDKDTAPTQGGSLKTLRVMRVLYLLIALFFTGFWLLVPFLSFSFATMQTIRLFELLWYLLANLILAMAFWIVSVGRLYCHLCPLGTVLAALARLGKMRIESGKTHCIGCGACDRACPMSISIKGYAMIGEPITSDQCVGCGHCIDACPTGTLSYSTAFLHLFRKKS